MTYRIPINSTTADASDINSNFYHVGQGSRSPYSGDDIEKTASSCNIGTSTAKWNNIFCNTVQFYNPSIGALAILSTIIVSTSVERVEFASLDDADKFFIVRISSTYPEPTATGYFQLTINGVSSATYLNNWIISRGNSAFAVPNGSVTQSSIYIGEYIQGVTNGTQFCNSEILILKNLEVGAVTENSRNIYSSWSNGFGNYVYELGINTGGIQSITSNDTISSIAIEGRFASNSIIELIGRR